MKWLLCNEKNKYEKDNEFKPLPKNKIFNSIIVNCLCSSYRWWVKSAFSSIGRYIWIYLYLHCFSFFLLTIIIRFVIFLELRLYFWAKWRKLIADHQLMTWNSRDLITIIFFVCGNNLWLNHLWISSSCTTPAEWETLGKTLAIVFSQILLVTVMNSAVKPYILGGDTGNY